MSQYFRQSSDQKGASGEEKKKNPICCINRLPSSEDKTSSVVLAWRGDRLLLELIEWRGPSVRGEAERSSSQKLQFILYKPLKKGQGGEERRGVTGKAQTAESAEQPGPTERPLWVRKCHISPQPPPSSCLPHPSLWRLRNGRG